MTHSSNFARLLGERAETKGRVLHLSCDFLSFSVNIKCLIIPICMRGVRRNTTLIIQNNEWLKNHFICLWETQMMYWFKKGILNARLYDSPYFRQWETAVNKKEEILAHVELAGHSYAPQLGALKFSEQFHKAAHSDHRKLRQGKAENTS